MLGAWNGFLVSVLGIQPIIATLVLMVAGRGIAMLITGGQITTVNSAPFKFIASGFLLTLPFAFLIAVAVFADDRAARPAAPRSACSSRRSASTRRRAAWPGCGRAAIIFGVYVVSGLCAGIAGHHRSSTSRRRTRTAAGLFIELTRSSPS